MQAVPTPSARPLTMAHRPFIQQRSVLVQLNRYNPVMFKKPYSSLAALLVLGTLPVLAVFAEENDEASRSMMLQEALTPNEGNLIRLPLLDSLIQAIERSLPGAQQADSAGGLLDYLVSGVGDDEDRNDVTIGAALAASPEETETIVIVSLKAGATAEEVAVQCRTRITPDQVMRLAKTAIGEGADPLPILRMCLTVVPLQQAFDLITQTLKLADPGNHESMIVMAFNAMRVSNPLEYDQFIASVLEAELRLAGEDATLDVERRVVEEMLEPILAAEVDPDMIEGGDNGFSDPGFSNEIDFQEDPASDS